MNIIYALASLRPNASWEMRGDNFEDLNWLDTVQSKPTEKEVLDEINRLKVESAALAYQKQRQAEYPPITDYLDGVVKGDQAQIQAYIDACLAIKAKYPKGV